MFDFEAFYRVAIVVCCVAVTISAVVTMIHFLRISRKEPAERYSEAIPESIDSLRMALDDCHAKYKADYETICYALNKRYEDTENLSKKVEQLEKKVNDIYVEE